MLKIKEMSLEAQKLDLINKITLVESEELLSELQVLFNQWQDKELFLKSLVAPVRKKTDLDEIIKAQNYKGFNRKEFDKLVKEIDIQEPVEELIKMI